MKLLLVTRLSFNPQVMRWIRELRKIEVDVACLHLGACTDAIPGIEEFPDIRVYYAYGSEGMPALPRALWALYGRYRAVLSHEQPNIVWVMCLWTIVLPLIWAARLARRPVAITICGSDVNSGARSFRNRLVFRQILRRCDLVSTTTPEMMAKVRQITSLDPERLLVRYWGVDVDRFRAATIKERAEIRQRLHISPEDFVIFMGRIHRRIAYHEEALRVLAKLRNMPALPRVRAVFVEWAADGGLVETVNNQIQELGLEDSCIRISRVLPPDELRELYTASDVMLNLLKQDQLGTMLFEAMLSGSIVVSTDLPQYLRVAREGIRMMFVRRDHLESDLLERIATFANMELSERSAWIETNRRAIERDYSFVEGVAEFVDRLKQLTSARENQKVS